MDKWRGGAVFLGLLLYGPVVGALIGTLPTRNSALYTAALAGDSRGLQVIIERGDRLYDGQRTGA